MLLLNHSTWPCLPSVISSMHDMTCLSPFLIYNSHWNIFNFCLFSNSWCLIPASLCLTQHLSIPLCVPLDFINILWSNKFLSCMLGLAEYTDHTPFSSRTGRLLSMTLLFTKSTANLFLICFMIWLCTDSLSKSSPLLSQVFCFLSMYF